MEVVPDKVLAMISAAWTKRVLPAVGILLAPPLAYVGLGVREMVRPQMIDPYFYGAYAQQGADLVQRYGIEGYFWVRVGFILPAHAFAVALGPTAGFYAFRYVLAVLAIGSAYLLLRRVHSPAAGAVAAATVLASPVVWGAWGTDYPDSSAVAYLTAGVACLAMPTSGPRRRVAWAFAGGALLALAVHSHLIAVPIAAGLGAGWFLAFAWRATRSQLAQLGAEVLTVVAAAAAVTLGLMVASSLVLRSGNIISPTLRAVTGFSTPEQQALWHSPGAAWLWRDTYLFVLPAVVVGWLVLTARAPRRPGAPATDGRPAAPGAGGRAVSRSEAAVVLGTALSGVAAAGMQFVRSTASLEFFLYSSMLWPGVCLTTALVVVRLLLRAPRLTPRHTALAAVAVVTVPAVLSWPVNMPIFSMSPVGWLLVGLAVGACLLARFVPLTPRGAGVLLTVLLVSTFTLTVGKLTDLPPVPGQVPFPTARYDDVLASDGSLELSDYRVVAQVPRIVPEAQRNGDQVLVWTPPGQPEVVAQAAAQYLLNIFASDLPAVTQGHVDRLRERRPSHLVLLGATDAGFADAVAALEPFDLGTEVVRRETLRSGASVLHVWVVRVGAFADAGQA